MLKLLTLFLVALLPCLTNAQKRETFAIKGVVSAGFTGKPIPEAYIKYARTTSAVTDSTGHFSIRNLPAGTYTLSFSAFGYENKDTTITLSGKDQELTWVIYTSGCKRFSKQSALVDISKGKPVLLLQGGIAPIVYSTDKAFMKKYKVGLFDFGDEASEYMDCIFSYNQTVFEYLDKKYGKKWRKEVRPDIIGLKHQRRKSQ